MELTLKEKQKCLRENAILDAAQEIIAAKGYDAVTMDDLAAHVGISKPTLYQHFVSKEMLAVCAIVRRMNEVIGEIAALPLALRGWDKLKVVLSSSLEKKFVQRLVVFGTAHAALRPMMQNNADYIAARQSIIESLSSFVEEAKRQNDIRPELSTPVIVQMLLCTMRDPDFLMPVDNGECTGAELVQTLLALIENGVRTHA